jgi:hypothetical protein
MGAGKVLKRRESSPVFPEKDHAIELYLGSALAPQRAAAQDETVNPRTFESVQQLTSAGGYIA